MRSYTRAVIWERWRHGAEPRGAADPPKPFEDLLEEAPVIALLVDRDQRVLAANEAGRAFFDIVPERLPGTLVEVTMEGNLVAALRAGTPEGEVQLVHHRRTVRSKLVPGPRPGETLVFLVDVTDLRRLERVRQEFVANLVHELKTPLTSLRLTAESLLGEPPARDRERFARRAVDEVDLISRIIDNLRQLAQLDAGELSVQASTISVIELLHDVAGRAGSEHPVSVAAPAGLEVEADRAKLTQALVNLVDNASKFSGTGSSIELGAAVHGSALRLSVRDHGAGISPEHWDRVFERFYRVDRSRAREGGGFGLGLAITKHLVHAMGGRVWTEAADGGGQVFTIEIPIALTAG